MDGTHAKNTTVDSGLDIDKPMTIPDGTEAELTIGEGEKRRIITLDNKEHSFSIKEEKGGSRSMIWGDPNY